MSFVRPLISIPVYQVKDVFYMIAWNTLLITNARGAFCKKITRRA